MGLFDSIGKIFSPKNIGTVLGGIAGTALLPGVGTTLGAAIGGGAGRTAAHLATGEGRTLGSTLGEATKGAGLGAAGAQIPGVGTLIKNADIPGLGGTPDVTGAATPPFNPEGWSPTIPKPWETDLGGAANVGAAIPGGSGEPGRLRRLLGWAEENPELAAGAVSGLTGLYGQYQQGRAEKAAAEYQMRRNENMADVSAALFRGLAKQLPRAA